MTASKWLVAIAVGSVLVLAGCMGTVPHQWQTQGNDRALMTPTDDWKLLPVWQYHPVTLGQVPAAVVLLEKNDIVTVTEDQVRLFVARTDWGAKDGLKPYLVRGVAFGGNPLFSVVRFDARTGYLVTFCATWNGENLFTEYGARKAEPYPFVVRLPSPPTKVFATAELGGDRLMANMPAGH